MPKLPPFTKTKARVKRLDKATKELRAAGLGVFTKAKRGVQVRSYGNSYNPAQEVSKVIQDAIDPTKAPGKVRIFTPEERAELEALYKKGKL